MRQQILHPSELHLSTLARTCQCSGAGPCECEKSGEMRRHASGARPTGIPAVVHDVLASAGKPLDEGARQEMELRFGHDFSRVRVHDDARAAESANAVAARAYTVGEHVVFGAGKYAPASDGGRRLLAHELTHVLQQSGGLQSSPITRISDPSDAAEREADEIAGRVVGGQ